MGFSSSLAVMRAGSVSGVSSAAASVPSAGWAPGTGCRTGNAIVTSLDLNMPNDDKASFTVTFTGTGPLTKYKPAS